MNDLAEFIEAFRSESEEMLDRMEELLLRLEQSPADDELQRLAERLRTHVQSIGEREAHVWTFAELVAAPDYMERELAAAR